MSNNQVQVPVVKSTQQVVVYVDQLIANLKKIVQYTADMVQPEQFVENAMCVDAVINCFKEAGEICLRLSNWAVQKQKPPFSSDDLKKLSA